MIDYGPGITIMKRFSELLHHQFQENSRRPAIIYRDQVLTFGELAKEAAAISGFLQEQGLKKGDIVILYTPDKLPFLLIHLGIILGGGISLPLNPDFTPEEMVYFLNDSRARFIFASGPQAALIRHIENKCPALEAVFAPWHAPWHREPIRPFAPWHGEPIRPCGPPEGFFNKIEPAENAAAGQVLANSLEFASKRGIEAFGPEDHKPMAGSSNKTLLRGGQGGGFLEKSPPGRRRQDHCFMLYSSGTTGQPKGVMHTQANIAASLLALQKCWKFTPKDVLLNVLPLYHIHGLSFATHLSLVSGSTMILEDRFHPLKTMEKIKEATVFMGIPTFYYAFLNRPEFKEKAKEWRRTRLFTCGSAPIRPEVLEKIETLIGKPLINRYGMTESHVITSLPLGGPYKHGSVGLPLEGVDIKIAKNHEKDEKEDKQENRGVGEVRVKSRNLFHHYWQRPEATGVAFDQEGFFRTGDLGYLDRDGYLFLVGRKNDLIISSGFNVYPPVVERVLNQFPGVKESAVIGIPDPLKGEKIMAVIVPDFPGNVNLAELKKHCREKLVPYQCPTYYEIAAELPRNTMGKVLKRELKEKFYNHGL
jgi:acyl-CoA synthetase (AMP-forming)/AMP-acid ligase II